MYVRQATSVVKHIPVHVQRLLSLAQFGCDTCMGESFILDILPFIDYFLFVSVFVLVYSTKQSWFDDFYEEIMFGEIASEFDE